MVGIAMVVGSGQTIGGQSFLGVSLRTRVRVVEEVDTVAEEVDQH